MVIYKFYLEMLDLDELNLWEGEVFVVNCVQILYYIFECVVVEEQYSF